MIPLRQTVDKRVLGGGGSGGGGGVAGSYSGVEVGPGGWTYTAKAALWLLAILVPAGDDVMMT